MKLWEGTDLAYPAVINQFFNFDPAARGTFTMPGKG